jgi:hypothetical protein
MHALPLTLFPCCLSYFPPGGGRYRGGEEGRRVMEERLAVGKDVGVRRGGYGKSKGEGDLSSALMLPLHHSQNPMDPRLRPVRDGRAEGVPVLSPARFRSDFKLPHEL